MHLIDQELNLMIRGRFEEGWQIAEEIERTDPNNPRGKFNRGWFLIHRGQFQEGYRCLENGRFLDVYGSPPLKTNKPIWRYQDLKNKVVLINLEAGYGDQIISSRFAIDVENRGGKAILACTPDIHCLFKRIPGCFKCIEYTEISNTRFDYWIPGFSCGWLFGHTFDSLPNQPYIFSDPTYVLKWKKILKTDRKFRVGIRWSGNPKFEHQQFRTFPADNLINLCKKYKNIQFYSLQRDNDLRELPEEIIDLQHQLETWDDTAACIENLDLVISSCTSIAHLSGAMGKKTWVIVPILPYHVWAHGNEHSPWYGTNTKIYRQTKFGDWSETFIKINDDLNKNF